MSVAPTLDDKPTDARVAVRGISTADLNTSLAQAWDDFREKRGDLVLIGILYPIIGIVTAVAAQGMSLLPFLFPLIAGLSLMGPVVATGYYILAKRREQGVESSWWHFLDITKSASAESIVVVALLLIAIFGAWIVSAGLIYAAFFGGAAPASLGDFVRDVFTTPQGWGMILVGNAVGAVFSVIVLAVSVVSLPMLVDKRVDAATAIGASVRATRANLGVMIRWGLTVVGLLFLGSLPAFLGLAVVLPLLGYATWHLYTKLVVREGLPEA